MNTYLETAPFVADSDTSREAAAAIKPSLGFLEKKVLYEISNYGSFGATCDDIEQSTGMRHQTCSARIRGLYQKNRIEDSGRRGKTRSGRSAVLWVAKESQ